MKCSLPSLCLSRRRISSRRQSRTGFTLVEIMVATTVLSLIMIAMSGILSSASSTCTKGMQRANNFTKARGLLETMSQDLRGIVLRPDLLAFPNSSFQFYTRRAGITTGTVRDISLVRYAINTTSSLSTLQRGDSAVTWQSPAQAVLFSESNPANLPEPTLRDIITGVVGFATVYHYQDGSESRAYVYSEANPLQAISLYLAVVDDGTLKQLSASQIAVLRNTLAQKVDATTDIKTTWDDYLQSGFPWADYPRSLTLGLRTYERHVTLALSL